MIYILTGPVRTGKTTALLRRTAGRQDTDGVLCPDDDNGKRYIWLLKARQAYPLEAEENTPDQDTIGVGRFRFLKSAFTEANNYLLSTAEAGTYKWLVIDELGKLELNDTGLHRAAKTLITSHENSANRHIILVVRDTLLHEIPVHYNFSRFQVVTKEELYKLV